MKFHVFPLFLARMLLDPFFNIIIVSALGNPVQCKKEI